MPGLAYALDPAAVPSGGAVVNGAASISQSGAHLTVQQQSSRAILYWNTFNIGSQASVNFQQPSASSVVLNRVTGGGGVSEIYGSLTANGQVFLINPSGTLFGNGAQVNVGGLVSSSLDISNADFLNGNYRFVNGGAAGSIVNYGTLTAADGGYIALLAPQVRNEGVIAARLGTVAIGAANAVTLDLSGTGLLSMRVDQSAVDGLIANNNLVQAGGGTVIMSARAAGELAGGVINNSGEISATRISGQGGVIRLEAGDITNTGTVAADGASGGQVSLTAGDTLITSGSVSARGSAGPGGQIRLLGDKVGLFGGAVVDASGNTGGGTVLVGGNFHGTGPEMNASMVYVDPIAAIFADAGTSGNGGNIAVWSDMHTQFYGTASARGGSAGGNGGFVEVSGHKLDFSGMVDTRAPLGETGTLLLDPTDITIINGAAATTSGTITCTPGNCTAPGAGPFTDNGTGNLTDGTLNAQLAINNVDLNATNDIVIAATAAIDLQSRTLTLTSTAGGITFGATTVAATGGGALGLNFVTNLDVTAGPDFSAVTTVNANGGGAGTILGSNAGETFAIAGANSGTVGTVNYTGVANLTGGTGNDNFNFTGAGSLTGNVVGGAGGNTLSYAGYGSAVSFHLAGTATGIGGTWSGITSIIGSAGSDTVVGATVLPGSQTYFLIGGADKGVVSGGIDWTSFENIVDPGSPIVTGLGSSLSGSITIGGSATLNGTITTGGAVNIGGPTTLGSNVTVSSTAGSIFFGSTIDGAFSLTANSSGVTTFSGNVGSTTPLASLTTDAAGTSSVGGNVTVTGGLTFNDPTSGGGLVLTSNGGGAITVNNSTSTFPATIDTSGAVIIAGSSLGSAGTPTALTSTPSALTLNGPIGNFFFTSPAIPSVVFATTGDSVIINGVSVAASAVALAATTTTNTTNPALPIVINNPPPPPPSPVPDPTVNGGGGTMDPWIYQPTVSSGLTLDAIRQIDQQLYLARTQLFSTALAQLAKDSSLADVPDCDDGGSQAGCIRKGESARAANLVSDKTERVINRRVALLFGNDRYLAPIEALQTPIHDVEDIGRMIKDRLGYETHIVRNATRDNIIEELNRLAAQTKADDSVLIVYAGHGYQAEKGGSGYWIPVDASNNQASTWLSNRSISRFLSNIAAGQVMLVSDSCYSGTLARERKMRASETTVFDRQEILRQRSVMVMSSGGDEPVADGGHDDHSLFTYHLLRSLSGVKDGLVGSDIHASVRAAVMKEYPQDPQYGIVVSAGGADSGEYLIEKKP